MAEGFCGGVGSMPLGSGPFGSGAIGIVEARASALNAVDVLFDVATPSAVGDPADFFNASNPNNWSLQVLQPFGAVVRLAQLVEALLDGLTLRVFWDGVLDPRAQYAIVLDERVGNVGCREADFFGLIGPRPLTEVQRQERLDIANPQLLKDAPVFDPPPLGTYQLTDTGDFAQDSGRASYRKRIFRRLTSPENGFFHLVGYGLQTDEKQLIRPDILRTLKSKAESQILREPETVAVRVSASQDPQDPKVVNLLVKARDNIGDIEPFTVPIVIG